MKGRPDWQVLVEIPDEPNVGGKPLFLTKAQILDSLSGGGKTIFANKSLWITKYVGESYWDARFSDDEPDDSYDCYEVSFLRIVK